MLRVKIQKCVSSSVKCEKMLESHTFRHFWVAVSHSFRVFLLCPPKNTEKSYFSVFYVAHMSNHKLSHQVPQTSQIKMASGFNLYVESNQTHAKYDALLEEAKLKGEKIEGELLHYVMGGLTDPLLDYNATREVQDRIDDDMPIIKFSDGLKFQFVDGEYFVQLFYTGEDIPAENHRYFDVRDESDHDHIFQMSENVGARNIQEIERVYWNYVVANF